MDQPFNLPENPITSYTFGSMVISGTTYTSDLIILPGGRVQENWQRALGHLLQWQDLETLIAAAPRTIIAGTGAHGRMALDHGLALRLAAAGIELVALTTDKAVERFNQGLGPKVGACFHLTC